MFVTVLRRRLLICSYIRKVEVAAFSLGFIHVMSVGVAADVRTLQEVTHQLLAVTVDG